MRSINEIDDLAPSVQRLSVELDLNWEWYPLRRRLVASSQCAQRYSAGCYVRTLDPRRQYDVLTHWEWEEMRLAYDGMGVIDDKQRPGWMSRVLDWVYPF